MARRLKRARLREKEEQSGELLRPSATEDTRTTLKFSAEMASKCNLRWFQACPNLVVTIPPIVGYMEVLLEGYRYLSPQLGLIHPSNLTIWRTNMDIVLWKKPFISPQIVTTVVISYGDSWDKATFAKVKFQFWNYIHLRWKICYYLLGQIICLR